jgi:hypothetical protein
MLLCSCCNGLAFNQFNAITRNDSRPGKHVVHCPSLEITREQALDLLESQEEMALRGYVPFSFSGLLRGPKVPLVTAGG